MAMRRAGWCATLALTLFVGGCTTPAPVPENSPAPTAAPEHSTYPAYPTYPVGIRRVQLSRGPHRPLPTLIFYPKTSRGRFPLVLFSHGLSGSPERYTGMLADWAAAGFVVAAPRYPHTNQFTRAFRRRDIVNQPADARYVLASMRRLNLRRSDPLWHRIDGDRVAAVGHSAGGYTTTGLFTAGHDARLRAGVVMAGWAAAGAFAGPPAAMLFVQGTADPIVPVAVSRRAYALVPWPKSYLLLRRESHATYLYPGNAGYRRMQARLIDFLRRTLGAEAQARTVPLSGGCPERAAQWVGCIGVR